MEDQMMRDGKGRYLPGASGNPQGRPKGSLNKATVAIREKLEMWSAEITERLIQDALAGKPYAMKICTDRLMPVKETRVAIELPKVETSADAAKANAQVIEMAAEGALSLEEAKGVLGLLEHQRKVLETEELEKRVLELEAHYKKEKKK